ASIIRCSEPSAPPAHPQHNQSRSTTAYGNPRFSSTSAISIATELFPVPKSPVMRTAWGSVCMIGPLRCLGLEVPIEPRLRPNDRVASMRSLEGYVSLPRVDDQLGVHTRPCDRSEELFG